LGLADAQGILLFSVIDLNLPRRESGGKERGEDESCCVPYQSNAEPSSTS
jgi:hypothetical protein